MTNFLGVDINCDMGESFGNFIVGNDEAIFPYITSCNVACGFHGGDPLHIEKTLEKALQYGLRIGGHPSYPDLQGFGRRKMFLNYEELKAMVKYQLSAVKGILESLGGNLSYVKPHGALYNSITENKKEAQAVIEAIQAIDKKLTLMGLAGSKLEKWADEQQISFIAEAFADRRYQADGSLLPRSEAQALIQNPQEALEQVLMIVNKQQVKAVNGDIIPLKADSFCVHGDNPSVLPILQAFYQNKNNIS